MDESKMSSAPSGDCTQSHIFRTCLWVFLFLLAIRLVRAFIFARDLINDDFELDRVAFALVNHLGFANPYKVPTGPTTHVAPAYPLILAGIYRIFGTGSSGEAVRQILACCVTCLQFALLPAIAAAAKLRPRVGVLAALVGGLSPQRNYIETKAAFETVYTALLLVFLSLLTLKMWNLEQSFKRAWFLGMIWGVALLFAPMLLPVLLAYLALGAFQFFRTQPRSYFRFSLTLLLASAIILIPWTLRNYSIFHRVIFVRGNFGLELNVSNNDSALPLLIQNRYTEGFESIHPFSSRSAAQAVGRLGESAYYDQQLHTAYRWIGSHPRRFLHLTADRIRYFWFPPLQPGLRGTISTLVTWSLTLGGIGGLFMMLGHHRWPALAIGSIWLTYPLVYYFLQFDLRYRYPIEWTLILSASYCLESLADQVMPGILREHKISAHFASFKEER